MLYFFKPKAYKVRGKKRKLFLTIIEFLDKFKREVQCLFHQVEDVGSEDAVGLRADFYCCGVIRTVVEQKKK